MDESVLLCRHVRVSPLASSQLGRHRMDVLLVTGLFTVCIQICVALKIDFNN
jgi:hypothetical protein